MVNNAFSFSGDDAFNYETYLGPLLFETSSVEFLSRLNVSGIGSLLELAAGTGRMTKHFREYFDPSTIITATDISGDMLSLAKKNLNDPSINFLLADIQQLPFPDNSFDMVVCQYGLMFLPDKQKGFSEIFRVLKPGGHFIFSTWDSTRNIPLINTVFDEVILPLFESGDHPRLTTPFSLHDPEKLKGYLKEAGFTHNEVISVSFKSGPTSAENVVNGFFLKHPLSRSVAERNPIAVTSIAENMERRLIARFGSGDIIFDLRSFIGSGQK